MPSTSEGRPSSAAAAATSPLADSCADRRRRDALDERHGAGVEAELARAARGRRCGGARSGSPRPRRRPRVPIAARYCAAKSSGSSRCELGVNVDDERVLDAELGEQLQPPLQRREQLDAVAERDPRVRVERDDGRDEPGVEHRADDRAGGPGGRRRRCRSRPRAARAPARRSARRSRHHRPADGARARPSQTPRTRPVRTAACAVANRRRPASSISRGQERSASAGGTIRSRRRPRRRTARPPCAAAHAVPAERVRDRADVGPGADAQLEPRDAAVVDDELERVYLRPPQRHLHRHAAPAPACTRAHRRSSPPRRPGSAARSRRGAPRARRSSSSATGGSCCSSDLALGVARRRRAREVDVRQVALVEADEALREPRRRAEQDEQEPGRERVERPGVPGARARRRRSSRTSANDDGPAGLSTRTRPAGSRPAAAWSREARSPCGRRRTPTDELDDLVHRLGRSRSRPPAGGRRPPSFRAIADTSTSSLAARRLTLRGGPASRGRLADQRGELGPSTARSVVDDPLGRTAPPRRPRRSRRASRYETTIARRPRSSCARSSARARSFSFGNSIALVDVLEDPVDVGAAPRRARPPRRSAFGVVFVYWKRPVSVTSADVERLRDRRRQRDVELGEDVREHLRRRGGVGDDEVRRRRSGCCRGGGRCRSTSGAASSSAGVAEALLVRAVDGDEHALGGSSGASADEAVERHEARTRSGAACRRARYMTLSLPSASSASFIAEQRAERVAVGVLVRRDDVAVVRADRVRDGGGGHSSSGVRARR